MSVSVLFYLLILLFVAFIGGTLLKLAKQPPVVGYLLGGLAVGILIGGSIAHETIEFLSELGVVLLLFTLGLEFSLQRVKRVARIAIVGGLVQICLTILVSTGLFIFLKFGVYPSIFMAAAFSLSSTAVVVKILTDRGEIDSLPGEILVAWLIIQDLAVLPMILILPAIGQSFQAGGFSTANFLQLLQSIFYAVGVLGITLVAGKKIIPSLISHVALLNNRELLLVAVFGIAVGGALFTQILGLSAALGAFLAGLLIAETSEQHAVFSEIRPLRDLFALLFFTTLGLVLPAGFVFSNFGTILLLTLVVISVKFVLVVVLTLYLGYHAKTSFVVGVGLIEVGEFAFILARVGLAQNVIDAQIYGLILSVALLSILIMPPLFLIAPQLYVNIRDISKRRFRPVYTKFFLRLEHQQIQEELPFTDHVVLCGYGRVGKYVGRALTMVKVPFVVVEYNQHKAKALRADGITVVYGDPADIDILDFAQVDKAKAVIIAIPDLHTEQQVVTNSLTLNKNVHIYCRTHHEENQRVLKALGVTTVIQPEFEAALSITDKILRSFGQKSDDIEGKMSRLKLEHGLG